MRSQQSVKPTASGIDIELREIPSRTSTAQHSDPDSDIQDMILKIDDVKKITNYIEQTDEKNRDQIKVLVLAYCCAHAKYSLAKTLIVNGVLTLQDFLKAKFTIKDVAPVLDTLLTEKEMLPIYHFLSKEKLLYLLRTRSTERSTVVQVYNQHKEAYPSDKLRISICQYLAITKQFKINFYNFLNETTQIEKKEIANTLRAALYDNPSPLNLLGNVLYHPRPVSKVKTAAFYGINTIAGIAFSLPTGGMSVYFASDAYTRWNEAPSLKKATLKKFLCLHGRLTDPDNPYFQEGWLTAAMSAIAVPEYEDHLDYLVDQLRRSTFQPTAISTAQLTAQPKSAAPLHTSSSVTTVSSALFSSTAIPSEKTDSSKITQRRLSQT